MSALPLAAVAALVASQKPGVPVVAPTQRRYYHPGEQSNARRYSATPAYVPKEPSSSADFAALARAGSKRARQAAKRSMQQGRGRARTVHTSVPASTIPCPVPAASPLRPVIYLDIDDTLVTFPPHQTPEWWAEHPDGGLADGAVAFLTWAHEHCEVRWLTYWCGRGYLAEQDIAKLERIGLPRELTRRIVNPMRWFDVKTTGINWEEQRLGREWVWLEDGLLTAELAELEARGCLFRYLRTNSSEDPDALRRSWNQLAAMLQLPLPGGVA
jgi:hypothetical protein